jgi:hypothetical protein
MPIGKGYGAGLKNRRGRQGSRTKRAIGLQREANSMPGGGIGGMAARKRRKAKTVMNRHVGNKSGRGGRGLGKAMAGRGFR